MKVYLWPSSARATRLRYGDPNRTRTTMRWDGAPGQTVAHVQRTSLAVEGEVWKEIAPDFDILMSRIRGGESLVAFTDFAMRARFGWDLDPAVDSNGNEFWRANGQTADYSGESANPPTGPWRSIFADAVGAHSVGDTTLDVDGLLDGETIPKGCWVRVGDFRYRMASDATANASGEATLTLSDPLRAAVSDNADVQIPGDLFVGKLRAAPEISTEDHRGIRSYRMAFNEVYEDEILDDSVSPAVGFEWTGL